MTDYSVRGLYSKTMDPPFSEDPDPPDLTESEMVSKIHEALEQMGKSEIRTLHDRLLNEGWIE